MVHSEDAPTAGGAVVSAVGFVTEAFVAVPHVAIFFRGDVVLNVGR